MSTTDRVAPHSAPLGSEIVVPTRALSICQPWAWAVASGHKPYENRTWKTAFTGPLAIHASSSPKNFATNEAICDWEDFFDAVGGTAIGRELDEKLHVFDAGYFGAIIGVATMQGCLPVADIPRRRPRDVPLSQPWPGAWAEGPHCFVMRQAVFFDGCPIKCPGKVSIFPLPASVIDQIAGSLRKLGYRPAVR